MPLFLESFKIQPSSFHLSTHIIDVEGVDAESYLQTQTTNDVKSLSEGDFQLNSMLDLAGKVVTSFVLCKKSNSQFVIIVEESFTQKTLERLEKFHISEEFSAEIKKQKSQLRLNSKSGNYCGYYLSEKNYISFTEEEAGHSEEEFSKLRILTGTPKLGKEVLEGEVINNSYLEELSVNFHKGCYPGQETVSKIASRRGAALKPVLLISQCQLDELSEKIYIEGKKVGEIRSKVTIGESSYIYALLNRETRIEGRKIEFYCLSETQTISAEIKYYPFLKLAPGEVAKECYDYAMECFLSEDNKQAAQYFQYAIDKDPLYEDAYESLGVLYGRMEKYGEAIELMEKLKQLNEKCLMAYTNLSLFHMKVGDIKTAEDYKSQATLLNFQVLGDQAAQKRAEAENKKKQQVEIERREGMFKQVLEMDGEDAMANNGMGEISLDRKDYLAAVSYFQAAINGDQKYSVAYLGLAKSLYQLNRIEESREILESGIKVASKNGDLMPANEMQRLLLSMN